MKKITYSKAIFPNLATGLNIFFGFVSIVYASQENFKLAALAIFVAAFFDLIDGLIARLLNTSSRLGVELDSLADVVSFGAAPSFLIYQAELISFGWLGIIISSCILTFGGFRLARFNVQLEDLSTKIDFKGLPIPAAGIAVASLVLFYHNGLNIIKPLDNFIIPIVLLLSLLMVSNIRYNTLPKIKYLKLSGKILIFSISFVALLAIFMTNGEAFFYLISAHIIFGIVRHIFNYFFNDRNSNDLKLNQKISES